MKRAIPKIGSPGDEPQEAASFVSYTLGYDVQSGTPVEVEDVVLEFGLLCEREEVEGSDAMAA